MQYIVGLTGGIGSGKSTVTNMFLNLDVTIVDADIIAREVVQKDSEGLHGLVKLFGESILTDAGELDRPQLRQKMFSETDGPQVKASVNQLLHPLIQSLTASYIAKAQGAYVLWVVPLLFENNLQAKANRVLVVDVPESIQIARTMARDNVSEAQVMNILKAQINRENRLLLADDVINGDESLSDMAREVSILDEKYRLLAKQHKS